MSSAACVSVQFCSFLKIRWKLTDVLGWYRGMELVLQTRGIVWKYSAAISGQYHNVFVNHNIMLPSHHRLEKLTRSRWDQERRTCNSSKSMFSYKKRHDFNIIPNTDSYTLNIVILSESSNDRLELSVSSSTEVFFSAEHLFRTIGMICWCEKQLFASRKHPRMSEEKTSQCVLTKTLSAVLYATRSIHKFWF